ncbi:hypothetical protein TSMEX_003802, partial [Taenia solium]
VMALFDINISDVENRCLFVCYLTLTIFASVTYFIAFVSPFWIVADSGSYALFNRIGLWTACFDGYMRPKQFNKAYFGCFYLYTVEYDSIREWLNPRVVVFFVLCQATGRIVIESQKLTKWLMTGHFIAGLSLLFTLLGFIYGSYDSRWVPYPRYNKLSWGFGTGVLSLILIVISFIAMLVFCLKVHVKTLKSRLVGQENREDDDDMAQDDDDRNVEDEIRKLASTSYSRNYSQPSGYLHPKSAGFVIPLESEIVEDLGDIDDGDNGMYSHL